MLRLFIALALAATVLGSAVELSSLDDLRSHIGKTKFLAVEFYAPWCGHCKNLAPHWKAAAEQLAAQGIPVTLAMIDADAHRDAGQEFGVQGFPTIKFFRDGAASDYNGPRDTEGIVNYFKRATGDHVVKATSASDWTKAMEEFSVSVLLVTDDDAHDGIIQAIGDSLWETVSFVHLSGSAAKAELSADSRFQCSGSPCVFIHRKNFENEDAVLEYKGDFTSEPLIAFINGNKMRSYGRLTQEDRSMIQAFFETKKAYKTIICVEDGNAEQLAVAAATPAALKAIGHADVFVGIIGSEFSQALNHFGVDESSLPTVIVHGNVDAEDKRKFKADLSAFSASEIAKFVKDAASGKVARWIKSEAEPSGNDGPVMILTGNTVHDIATDSTKDVLVEVYAPWCGHCKSLAPVYESVAEAFAGEPRVVIAKIDGTKNDFDLHPVQGFPTLVFFPANSKAAIPVQGRDARSLIQAVLSNSAFKDLKVNADALPKSGVVPQFLADKFPMLEEGVLALQSNVLVGPFTAFHFISAAIVIFTGFTIMLIRSGPSISAAVPAAAAAAAAPAAAAAAAAVPAAEPVPQPADAAPDAAADVSDPTEASGLKQTSAGSKSAAAAAAASGGAAAVAPKRKSSKQ